MNKYLILIFFLAFWSYALADDNELANVYYQSGMTLIKDSKFEEAIGKFEKALSYLKEFPQAHFKLGECYEKLNNNKNAIKNYSLCLKQLQEKSGLLKEEEELLNHVIKCLNKLDLSYRELTKAKSDYIAKLTALAGECDRKKYQRLASHICEMILSIEPDNKSAQDLTNKLSKKIPNSKQISKADIEESKKHCNSAMTYYTDKEYDKAIDELSKAIELNPRNVEAYYGRGRNYSAKGDYNKAAADFTQAIKLDPKKAESYNSRGVALYKKGDYAKSISDHTESIKLSPQKGPYYFNRAQAYEKQGNYKSAIEDMETYLKLTPGNIQNASEIKAFIEECKKKLNEKK